MKTWGPGGVGEGEVDGDGDRLGEGVAVGAEDGVGDRLTAGLAVGVGERLRGTVVLDVEHPATTIMARIATIKPNLFQPDINSLILISLSS